MEWNYGTSDYVVDHDYNPKRGIQPKEVYGKPVPTEFAGTTLMGVAKPDDYLRCCYGNYMELPKEIPPQNFRYLDLKTPWREYLKKNATT
jgi:lipopolysaccharide cholinephosphotransferase